MINPLVSVIVATYKRDDSLHTALTSLMKQTYDPVEIVVVDDNANEEWHKKVDAVLSLLHQEFPSKEILYIRNETNQGSARTRNIGIENAHGEYITFLDDDDIYLERKIEMQVSAMQKEKSDFSITDLQLYDDESDKLIDTRIRSYIKAVDEQSLLNYHLLHHITGTDTMMFRRDYLLKIGMFPLIDIGDEFYLMKEAICGGGSFLYIPGCEVKAYVHKNEVGLSSGQSKIDGENALFEYKKSLFPQIEKKNQRYICMRHHAVIAFAELRRAGYLSCLIHAAKAFCYAPLSCIKLVLNRKI